MSNCRAIPSLPGYSASDSGEVYNYDKKVVVSQWKHAGGYRCVTIRGKNYYVHRLVYSAFHPSVSIDGLVVRHMDDDPSNNSIVNLRHGTARANSQDMMRHGRVVKHIADQMEKKICVRGHPLKGENLTPSGLRHGHRHCRSCSMARSRVGYLRRKHGIDRSSELQELSDKYYHQISGVMS